MGRKARALCKYMVSIIAVGVFLILFYFLAGGALCNDLRAWRIEKKYASMELPDRINRIETVSYVGNTAGTGNLTEIWAGMLVYSELTKAEIEEYFKEDTVWEVPSDLEEMYPFSEDFISFAALDGQESGKGYFVVSRFYNAFSQFDLRGH